VHKLARVQLALVVVAPVVTTSYWYWYTHRKVPESAQEVLYEGVTYTRDVREEPNAVIAHIVEIDLDAPGVGFLVTPGGQDAAQEVLAQRTTDFLVEYDLQVAINGDFFEAPTPDSSNARPGTPLDVRGFASSAGTVYSRGRPWQPTLYISSDNRAQFNEPIGEVYNAISGDYIFLQDGVFQAGGARRSYHVQRHPRTAVALDADGQTLILIAVDGRQPNYSEGVSLEELAEIVLEYGGATAMNMDGGGSTTLVAQDESGKPLTLNTPMLFFPQLAYAVSISMTTFSWATLATSSGFSCPSPSSPTPKYFSRPGYRSK
jgi:hypothetical protein